MDHVPCIKPPWPKANKRYQKGNASLVGQSDE